MSHVHKIGSKIGILSVLATAALVLTGCVVAPAPYYQSRVAVVQPGASVSANVEYVQTPPPAEQTEVVTVSPGVGFIWTPGFWYWSGGRHVWRAGVWTRPPAGYRSWNRGGWYHAPGRGWYHSGGHWR
jgi:WXXGXW repeat (2 copies)